jgi:hypothetical protein
VRNIVVVLVLLVVMLVPDQVVIVRTAAIAVVVVARIAAVVVVVVVAPNHVVAATYSFDPVSHPIQPHLALIPPEHISPVLPHDTWDTIHIRRFRHNTIQEYKKNNSLV